LPTDHNLGRRRRAMWVPYGNPLESRQPARIHSGRRHVKREALNHTKMKRLCRRLGVPTYHGVGILESLWQLTAREAPRGDIGKLSDEDIAIGIDYRGEESALMEALVDSGWIDRSEEFRMIIHDWDEHADDAVHMRLARSRAHFCSGRAPKLARLGGKERTEAQSYPRQNPA
jgi:hypothetical protein